jgi:hypothetical protein
MTVVSPEYDLQAFLFEYCLSLIQPSIEFELIKLYLRYYLFFYCFIFIQSMLIMPLNHYLDLLIFSLCLQMILNLPVFHLLLPVRKKLCCRFDFLLLYIDALCYTVSSNSNTSLILPPTYSILRPSLQVPILQAQLHFFHPFRLIFFS